jgi:radical SAM superfamily enzyme YgiQ (UPF0313 family)
MESEKLLMPLNGRKEATKGVTQLRVVLINPPITPFERYGSNIGKAGGRQVPLGICYIAAVLRLGKIEVKIIDAEAENLDYKEIINRIKTFKADVVGITSTTVAFHRTLELTKKIKEYDKDLPVVLGGSHITALPDYSMSFDCFDYGVVGEGEITFYQLLQAINKGSDFEKVDGILFRKGGEIIKTKPREYIKDLDMLPFPARDMLADINLYPPPPMNYRHKPVLNLITSRGCPNRCIFCDRNVFGQRYREHSAEYVIKEIEHLVNEFGAKELAFVDDTFTINRKRV